MSGTLEGLAIDFVAATREHRALRRQAIVPDKCETDENYRHCFDVGLRDDEMCEPCRLKKKFDNLLKAARNKKATRLRALVAGVEKACGWEPVGSQNLDEVKGNDHESETEN